MSLSSAARAALDELARDNRSLANACSASFFELDALVCAGVVERVQRFLSVEAPPMLARIDAGDVAQADRLARAVANIRRTVVDEAQRTGAELSTGGVLMRFFDEVVAQSGADVVEGSRAAFPFLAVAIGGVGLLALAHVLRK